MTRSKSGRPAAAPAGKSISDQTDDPRQIVAQMERMLAALDRAGAGIAAAHLSMAIVQARAAFNLDQNGSESD